MAKIDEEILRREFGKVRRDIDKQRRNINKIVDVLLQVLPKKILKKKFKEEYTLCCFTGIGYQGYTIERYLQEIMVR